MKNNALRLKGLALFVLLCLVGTANALPQSPTKVGGTWTLTIAAANGGPAPAPITLTLEQS